MESGHSVIRLRDVMLDNSADPIVAAACREAGMVLITHNIKHFKQIAKEHQISHSEIDALCRIDLGCRQIAAVGRVKDALSVIEAEWERLATEKKGSGYMWEMELFASIAEIRGADFWEQHSNRNTLPIRRFRKYLDLVSPKRCWLSSSAIRRDCRPKAFASKPAFRSPQ